MRELEVDLAGHVPRRLVRSDAEWADAVFTMGDACPVLPRKRYLEWDLLIQGVADRRGSGDPG
jgi:arsenate reductase